MKLLAMIDIDAYIIASSTATHADLIEKCSEVGKPVFCEKPIDLSLERAESCAKLVEQSWYCLHAWV